MKKIICLFYFICQSAFPQEDNGFLTLTYALEFLSFHDLQRLAVVSEELKNEAYLENIQRHAVVFFDGEFCGMDIYLSNSDSVDFREVRNLPRLMFERPRVFLAFILKTMPQSPTMKELSSYYRKLWFVDSLVDSLRLRGYSYDWPIIVFLELDILNRTNGEVRKYLEIFWEAFQRNSSSRQNQSPRDGPANAAKFLVWNSNMDSLWKTIKRYFNRPIITLMENQLSYLFKLYLDTSVQEHLKFTIGQCALAATKGGANLEEVISSTIIHIAGIIQITMLQIRNSLRLKSIVAHFYEPKEDFRSTDSIVWLNIISEYLQKKGTQSSGIIVLHMEILRHLLNLQTSAVKNLQHNSLKLM